MQTVKFYSIPKLFNESDYQIEFDGNKTDLRLHLESHFNWGAKTKKEYLKAQKLIDDIQYKGKGWVVYAWYDVSSYEYWMKNMCEQNYIQISIAFDSENIDKSELPNLYSAIDNAWFNANDICNSYDYDPCPYNV